MIMTDNVHSLHRPNLGMIRDHLEKLFHRARQDYPGSRCEIAWSDARGQVTSGLSFPTTPEGLDGKRPNLRYRFIKKGDLTVLYVPGQDPRLRTRMDSGS